MPFDGETYDRDQDRVRLESQLVSVRGLMSKTDRWWTLADLERELGYPQASISARIRDLRKPKFGGWEVQRRRVEGGLHEYRLVLPSSREQLELL